MADLDNFPKTAKGVAKPATPQEIAREDAEYFLATDESEAIITTDSGLALCVNLKVGYTNPNLHRRIEDDLPPAGSNYPFVHYDQYGVPYKQSFVLGIWDGVNSYRTTTTYTHDEESTTCEIP